MGRLYGLPCLAWQGRQASLKMTDWNDAFAVDKDFNDYYLALGRFVHEFSNTEKMIQYLLRQESQISGSVGPAIFSGVSISSAKTMINRVRAAKNIPDDPLMIRVFAQITNITNKRNDILHYGSFYTQRGFEVSNEIKAHIPERIEKFDSSPDILGKMTADLNTIFYGLSVCIQNAAARRYGMPTDPSALAHLEAIRRLADAPWQYTPPQQPPSLRQRPERPPGQTRRRGSSQQTDEAQSGPEDAS